MRRQYRWGCLVAWVLLLGLGACAPKGPFYEPPEADKLKTAQLRTIECQLVKIDGARFKDKNTWAFGETTTLAAGIRDIEVEYNGVRTLLRASLRHEFRAGQSYLLELRRAGGLGYLMGGYELVLINQHTGENTVIVKN